MGKRSHRVLTALLAAALGAAVLLLHPFERSRSSPASGRQPASRSASDPAVRQRVLLGRSVDGRPIYGLEPGDPDTRRRVLAVGVIHGNEIAGLGVTRDLARRQPPREALLWIVEDLNPDGVAAGTRQNANGVDLNRNFPYRWRPLGPPGGTQYSDPRPLSEPEARVAHSLILRVRPRITVWFHQPLGLVDESGGSLAIERRFARAAALPLQRLTRYPGSAAGWQNHRLPGSTAFVVELPAGVPSARARARYANAVSRIAS
jgi:murein peptide amidase A